MTNQEIAKIFKELAVLYEMNDDKFRVRAYENGARELEALQEDAADIYKRSGLKGLEDLPEIGKGMAGKIEEFIKTGRIKEFEALHKKMPVNTEELSFVEGLGPKGIKILYKKLGIKNLKDLEGAAKAGKIRKLSGFGEKSEKNILQSIEFVKKNSGRMLLGYILPIARGMIDEFKKIKEVEKISEAGSLRRRRETIGDIDLLVSSKSPEATIEKLKNMPGVMKVWGAGETKASVRIKGNYDIDLRVVSPESWGAALQYFTGSKEHNIKVRQIAMDKGMKLNEYGLYKKGKKLSGETEEEIYKALGLCYLEPELREDTGEIELAKYVDYVGHTMSHIEKLHRVIEYGSLRGDLQVHTNWTDGDNSIEEMAREAQKMGLEYIAITDHTKSLAMTGGADEKKLLRQMAEIDQLNKKISGIKILKGAEVNILKDGNLDIEDKVLERLDVVGVSVHSFFKMSKKDMTDRIIRAIKNPNVDILFHPTGRLIQRRDGYQLDIAAVIKEAIKHRVVLEINAFPDRLDLKDDHIRMAVGSGAKLCINSDAHSKEHFKYLEFGVAQARRGWAKEKDIINTLPLREFLKRIN